MEIKKGDRFIIEIDGVYKGDDGREVYRAKGADTLTLSRQYIKKWCERLDPDAEVTAYDQGLTEAWDAARIIGKNSVQANLDMFNECLPEQVIEKYDAKEVIDKLNGREEEQQSFRPGDKVQFKNGTMKGYIHSASAFGNIVMLQEDGKAIFTTADMIKLIGGNVLDDMREDDE